MKTQNLRRVVILVPSIFFAVVLLLRVWLVDLRSSWIIDLLLFVVIVFGIIAFTNWVFTIIDQREDEIRTRTYQLRGLHDAALALTTELDLATVLQRVVDQARNLVDAKYGALGVLNAEGTYIDQFITSGLSKEAQANMGLPPRGHGVLGAILTESKTIRLDRIRDDPRSVGYPPNHPEMTTFIGVPIQSKGSTIGNLYLVDKLAPGRAPASFSQSDQEILEMFATQAAIAIENARLYRQTQQLVILQERERFGMNLHDGIIQSIYAIGLLLEDAVHWLREKPESSEGSIDSAIAGLNDVIRDIRNYILDLRPQRFQGRNLHEGVEELVRDLRANSFLEIQVTADSANAEDLSPESTVEILHIAQEALANIRKHARATRVEIRIELIDGDLVVCVQDNGVGIHAQDLDSLTGNGLRNMRDRARNLGGELEYLAVEPSGTMVRLVVPRNRL